MIVKPLMIMILGNINKNRFDYSGVCSFIMRDSLTNLIISFRLS